MSLLGGLLVARSECQSGKEILKKYEADGDGILAWHEYDKKFNSDGHKDIRIRKLEKVISQPYHRSYRGGLAQWISDYESAFAELVELQTDAEGQQSTWSCEDARKRRMFQNAQQTGVSPTVMEELTKDMNFSDAAMLLRKHALMQHDEQKQSAARNVHNTKLKASDESSVTEALVCKLAQVPPSLWRNMDSECRKWIIAERLRQNREVDDAQQVQKNSEDTSKPSTKPLPNQYSRANQVTSKSEDPGMDVVDEFLAQAMAAFNPSHDEGTDDHLESVQRVNRTVTVSSREEQVAHVMHTLTLATHEQLSLSDNGSDTCVLGNIWHILQVDAFRTASLLGLYQFEHRKRLPIVSGIAAIDLPQGSIIVQSNESIYDKNLNHTIMSEFQMGEVGNIVDSRAKRHGGSQSIKIVQGAGDDVTIPLTLSAALMYFKIRAPTEDEIQAVSDGDIVPFQLTSGDKPWRPKEYTDTEAQEFHDAVMEYTQSHATIQHSFPPPSDKSIASCSTAYHSSCDIAPSHSSLPDSVPRHEDDCHRSICSDGSMPALVRRIEPDCDESTSTGTLPALIPRQAHDDSSSSTSTIEDPFFYDPTDADDPSTCPGVPTVISFTSQIPD